MRRLLAATLLLTPALACTEPNPYLGVCGNGVVEADQGEECDDGLGNGDAAACTASCKIATCGDGLLQKDVEACDMGADNDDQGACTTQCTRATCGDGFVQGDEACDDGDANKSEADGQGGCSIYCVVLAACGDGVVQSKFEACDDGNQDDNDACTNACTKAKCGDGIVQAGVEECDDGNTEDTDACTGACRFAKCGDGIVQAGVEGCDDGNDSNDDACLNVCVAATCGDGVIQADTEECDGGDGCNDLCLRDRLVFLTDAAYLGMDIQGMAGADAICVTQAGAGGHPKPESFLAWLGDGASGPADRFPHGSARYALPNGDVVAANWGDLTDGSLVHPIDRTFAGAQADVAVWTAVRVDGSTYDDATCDAWTAMDGSSPGHVGHSGSSDATWTDDGAPTGLCGDVARLYCFEAI
ncbi:MAG: DUF4215 domain-containing protein [Nannocystaceae bacterium]